MKFRISCHCCKMGIYLMLVEHIKSRFLTTQFISFLVIKFTKHLCPNKSYRVIFLFLICKNNSKTICTPCLFHPPLNNQSASTSTVENCGSVDKPANHWIAKVSTSSDDKLDERRERKEILKLTDKLFTDTKRRSKFKVRQNFAVNNLIGFVICNKNILQLRRSMHQA